MLRLQVVANSYHLINKYRCQTEQLKQSSCFAFPKMLCRCGKSVIKTTYFEFFNQKRRAE